MSSSIPLIHGEVDAFVPAPRAVQAGDHIFTSSIYPVDGEGHAVGVDPLLDEARPSPMEVQTQACLDQMEAILSGFGGSLERAVKLNVHLVRGARPEWL